MRLTPAEREAAVSGITQLLERQALRSNVALTLPYRDIVTAHETVEQGKAMGNVVVSLG